MGSPAHLKHAVVACIALGAVACATILAIDDRTLDTLGTDASTDSSVSGAEGSADVSTDLTMATDVSKGDVGVADAASGDAPQLADVVVTDAPGVDARATDAPESEASGDPSTCPNPCVLVTGLNHPLLMTSDTSSVYWTEYGDTLGSGNGYVKGCPVTGCDAGPTVYAQGLTNPLGVAVDSANIYFGAAGAIYTCPLSGCTAGPTMLTAASQPYGVAVDAMYVYWVDDGDSTVHRVAKTGAGNQVLYDAGDNAVYQPYQCVVDGPFIYFMDYNEDAFRLSVGGGPLTWLGSGNNGGVYGKSFGITTDPANVYFGGNGIVLRGDKMKIDGGAPISNTIPRAAGLAHDPATGMIYWANVGSYTANDGTVGKMAIDGGSAQVLAASLVTPVSVTISGNDVLWLSYGTINAAGTDTVPNTGALFRRAK